MHKFLFRSIACALACFALVAGAGCGKKPEVINIGAILPLTGSEAGTGNQYLHGLVLAIEELNKSNPNVVFKLVTDNDRNDWSLAISAFKRQLMDDKILVACLATRTECLAVLPEAEKEFVPVFANCSHPLMTMMHINAFRNCPNTASEIKKMAAFISTSLKPGNIAVLFIDDDYGRDAEREMKNELPRSGVRILTTQSFGGPAADAQTAAKIVTSQKPGAIYVYGHGAAAADVLAALRKLGYAGTILGSYDFSEPAFAELARESLEDCYYPALQIGLTGNKGFADRYRKRFNVIPTVNSIIEYDAMLIIAKAVEIKNTERISIANALKKVGNFSGAVGDYEYVDREWQPSLRIVQMKEGKANPVH